LTSFSDIIGRTPTPSVGPLERRRALDLDLIIAAKPDAPLLQAETALQSPPAYE
jgi:hypothetical protein